MKRADHARPDVAERRLSYASSGSHVPVAPCSVPETRRSRRYQRVSFHESHHQRQLPGFHGNSPLQGRWIGGGMCGLVGRTAAAKVRLISLPIKPSLCTEQLSTAISKACQDYPHFHTAGERRADAAASCVNSLPSTNFAGAAVAPDHILVFNKDRRSNGSGHMK
ncbi:unnamed protein product [Pleuronectes platessa]|uniref:Uncharacterized protein n=1 Tax=Pleuronectes platessa TaxID=8262 RepID=A0A9N7UMH7_PLEPL|nr:unnamed protein product [Pleuronectes platessa]